MKFPAKWSLESGLDGGARWSRIALRRGSREKREILSLKDFRAEFSKRKEKGKMGAQWSPDAFIPSLKRCVLQPDLPHPQEGPRVFHSGHLTRL